MILLLQRIRSTNHHGYCRRNYTYAHHSTTMPNTVKNTINHLQITRSAQSLSSCWANSGFVHLYCINVGRHVSCMYLSIYLCMHACTYVCACIAIYVCIYLSTYCVYVCFCLLRVSTRTCNPIEDATSSISPLKTGSELNTLRPEGEGVSSTTHKKHRPHYQQEEKDTDVTIRVLLLLLLS